MKKENIQTRNRKQNLKRKDKELGMQFASFITKSSSSQQLNEATNNYLSNIGQATSNITSSHNSAIPSSAYFQNAQFNFNLSFEPKFQPHSTQLSTKYPIPNYHNQRNIFPSASEQKNSTSDFYLPPFSSFQNFPVFNDHSRSNYLPHSVVPSEGSLLSASGVAAVAAAAAAAAVNSASSQLINSSNQYNSESSSCSSPNSPQFNYSIKKPHLPNKIHYQHHSNHHLHSQSAACVNLSSNSNKFSNLNHQNSTVNMRDFEQIPCY